MVLLCLLASFRFDIVLQFLVVYEIAASVFRPLGYWAADVRKRAISGLAISIIIVGVLTLLPKPEVSSGRSVLRVKINRPDVVIDHYSMSRAIPSCQ